jgi:hypothetical protein
MEVDESFAGRPARCPTCGEAMTVPRADASNSSSSILTPAAPTRPGAAKVRVDGTDVEVLPPLDTMVVVSLAFVAAAALLPLLFGLALGFAFQYPWTVGMMLGGIAALMGLLIGIPAYHNVRRSKGRKRGRAHAQIAILAGLGLLLISAIGTAVGMGQWLFRPPCEENLQRIYAALRARAEKHDGRFPARLEDLAAEGYLDSATWLTCPAYKVRPGTPTYILVPHINVSDPRFPPDMMIASDGPPYGAHEDGMVRVLWLDGTIKHMKVDDYLIYQKNQAQRLRGILSEAEPPPPPPDDGPPPPPPGRPPPGPGGRR